MKNYPQLKKDKILKEHNIPAYQLIDEEFQSEGRKLGLVQATGTGKSFVAIQMLNDHVFDQEGKCALYITSQKPIINQFESHLKDLNLDDKENLDKLDCLIYPSLLNLSDVDIEALQYDYIILDEFHRVGAEKWGNQVKKLLAYNQRANVLGLSATPIRYLDNGRDMAKELFGENVIEGVNLRESVEQEILPKAEYYTGVFSYAQDIEGIENKVAKIIDSSKREKLENWIAKAKRRIEDSDGLEDIFAKNIKNKSGKFVGFCVDHEKLSEIKDKIKNGMFSKVNQNVKIYEVSYADSAKKVKKTINEFENDNSSSLKIMLSVDMFNEGLHIKGIDGCMMFRPTVSPRIYLQQLGRALSVGDEKTPVIFDIVNNISSIKTIGEVFIDEKERDENPYTLENYFPFHVDAKNLEIPKLLSRLDELATYYSTSTEKWLFSAEEYAKKHGNLDMSKRYFDKENDVALGYWLQKIRTKYNSGNSSVDADIVERLIGLDPNVFEYTLTHDRKKKEEKILRCARKFFEQNGHLAVPDKGVVDPLTGENYPLALELRKIRKFKKGEYGICFNQSLIEELEKIDPRVFEDGYSLSYVRERKEEKILHFAKIYFEKNGNLAVRRNGSAIVTDDKTGETFNLDYEITKIKQGLKNKNYSGKVYGKWLIDELQKIDPRIFEERYSMNLDREEREEKILRCAKEFFEKNNNLAVITKGKNVTIVEDPITGEALNLGNEIKTIRGYLKGTSSSIYSDKFVEALKEIDPRVFEDYYFMNLARELKEQKIVRCAEIYFNKHNNLAAPVGGKGVVFDPVTQQEFDLGMELFYIRKFAKGNKSYIYNDSLIKSLTKIDPRVLESGYSRNSNRKNKEKGE